MGVSTRFRFGYGVLSNPNEVVAVVTTLSEGDIFRAEIYLKVRETQKITRIDENGFVQAPTQLTVEQASELLSLGNGRAHYIDRSKKHGTQ